MAPKPLGLQLLLLAVVLTSVSTIDGSLPPRDSVTAREQDPLHADNFRKREVENCVPYDIRSSIVGTRAVVEWATRRTYIRAVKLQKEHDRSPALANPWRSCSDVAAGVEVRYRRLGDNDTILSSDSSIMPFTSKKAMTYTAEEATFTTHTAFIDLSKENKDAGFEFIVGSVYHGWSATHRLGISTPFRGDASERCRPKHVHTAYGHTAGSLAVQWMTKEFCGEGTAQIQMIVSCPY
ncbi:hypothetical protein Plhal304r1_c065g0153081 [Plasmopara halstedii]